MPLRPVRAARHGVIGAPVARTVAVVGTAKVVSNGINRRQDRARQPPGSSPLTHGRRRAAPPTIHTHSPGLGRER